MSSPHDDTGTDFLEVPALRRDAYASRSSCRSVCGGSPATPPAARWVGNGRGRGLGPRWRRARSSWKSGSDGSQSSRTNDRLERDPNALNGPEENNR